MPLVLRIENMSSLPDGGPVFVELDRRGIDIGRDTYLDWTLPDPERFISGKHCEIRYEDGGFWVHDVSTNGTLINNAKSRLAGPHKLSHGDRIHIGNYILIAELSGEEATGGSREIPNKGGTHFGGNPWGGIEDVAPPVDNRGWNAPPPSDNGAGQVDRADEDIGWSMPVSDKPVTPGPETWSSDPTPPPAKPATDAGAGDWSVPEGDPFAQPAAPAAEPDPFETPEPVASAPVPEPEPEPVDLPAAEPEAPEDPVPPEPVFEPAEPVATEPEPDVAEPEPVMAAPELDPAPIPEPEPAPAPEPEPEPEAAPAPNPSGGLASQWAGGQQPERPEPAPAPAAPAPAAAVDGGAFVAAFEEAAGMRPGSVQARSDLELAAELGRLMRSVSEKLQAMLLARAETKGAMRSSERTMIGALENNPLKFSPTPEDALKLMFGEPTRSYLDAEKTVEQSFADLQKHQMQTFVAMQQALQALIEDMSPERIEGDTSEDSGLAKLVGSRRAKFWDTYVERFKAKSSRHERGMIDAYMVLFAEMYDRQGRS